MKKIGNNRFIESDMVCYKNNIFIYLDNDIYYFESNNPKIKNFSTCDYLVAVSALMKIKTFHTFNEIWDLKITDTMRYNINIENALYWITGGDKEWKYNNLYNNTWDNYSKLFVNEFENKLLSINNNANTLRECRDEIIKYLSLLNIYEFSIVNNLIRK